MSIWRPAVLAYHRLVDDAKEDPRPDVTGRPLPWPLRAILAAIGLLSLATGIIGLFVPGLPTTVFILIAAACAARSSPGFHRWLLAHPVFGSIIRNWQAGGRVSRRAKRSAALSMAGCAALTLWLMPWPWSLLPLAIMSAVLIWLWQRPEG